MGIYGNYNNISYKLGELLERIDDLSAQLKELEEKTVSYNPKETISLENGINFQFGDKSIQFLPDESSGHLTITEKKGNTESDFSVPPIDISMYGKKISGLEENKANMIDSQAAPKSYVDSEINSLRHEQKVQLYLEKEKGILKICCQNAKLVDKSKQYCLRWKVCSRQHNKTYRWKYIDEFSDGFGYGFLANQTISKQQRSWGYNRTFPSVPNWMKKSTIPSITPIIIPSDSNTFHRIEPKIEFLPLIKPNVVYYGKKGIDDNINNFTKMETQDFISLVGVKANHVSSLLLTWELWTYDTKNNTYIDFIADCKNIYKIGLIKPFTPKGGKTMEESVEIFKSEVHSFVTSRKGMDGLDEYYIKNLYTVII